MSESIILGFFTHSLYSSNLDKKSSKLQDIFVVVTSFLIISLFNKCPMLYDFLLPKSFLMLVVFDGIAKVYAASVVGSQLMTKFCEST